MIPKTHQKNLRTYPIFYGCLWFLWAGLWGHATPLHAASPWALGSGVAWVEEGDDRHRPAAAIHLDWGSTFGSADVFSHLIVYGRKQGPVQEQTLILNTAKRWSLLKSKVLSASMGFSLLQESIRIQHSADSSDVTTEDAYNAGASFGAHARLPHKTLLAELGWESHVFLAGTAGLFLSTGRKQAISLNLGYLF